MQIQYLNKYFKMFLFILSMKMYTLHAQNNKNDCKELKSRPIVNAELYQEPQFKNGENAMYDFINSNIILKFDSTDLQTYDVYIIFRIDTNGAIIESKIIRPSVNCNKCDSDALRISKLF